MKKHCKFSIFILVFILFCSSICSNCTDVFAVQKAKIKRNIAIVYDNSMSMFDNKSAWCQAQYAMEVFASMMNDGDNLTIYPMMPLTVGGDTSKVYCYNGTPITITEDSQKDQFKTFCTNFNISSTTPVEAIDAAFNGLKDKQGENWLIVLTDGDKFHLNNVEQTSENTQKLLEDRFSQYVKSVNISYLGIGTKEELIPAVETQEGYKYISRSVKSKDVPSTLAEVSNLIFGRDELPSDYYTNNSFKTDIPLSKLYAFVQGENISNIKITDSKGTEIKATKTFNPKYAEKGCINYDHKSPADTSLQGVLAELSNVEIGQYNVSYSGKASSVTFFYEPDADLCVQLYDSEGKNVTTASSITPGEYDLKYYIADANGTALDSKLLGSTYYKYTYQINGKKISNDAQTSGSEKITLNENDLFCVNSAEVTFLSGYKISKTGSELDFNSSGFSVQKGAAKDFSISVTEDKIEVDADKINEVSFNAIFTYDGVQLTGDALENVVCESSVSSEGISVKTEREADGYKLTLCSEIEDKDIVPGDYIITTNGTYSDSKTAAKTVSTETALTINDAAQKLTIEYIDPKTSYTESSLKKSNGILFNVLVDGQPISTEQAETINLSATCDDKNLTIESTDETGKYCIKISDSGLKSGKINAKKYTLTTKASNVVDKVGNTLETESDLKISVRLLPRWLNLLLWLLLVALILLIILLISRIRVLPKSIKTDAKLTINGSEVSADVTKSVLKKKDCKVKVKYGGKTYSVTFHVTPGKESFLYKKNKNRLAVFKNSKAGVSCSSGIKEIKVNGVNIDFINKVEKAKTVDLKNAYTISGEGFSIQGKFIQK